MITNISDRKDTSFLSIDKALSNKFKFSLLKNGDFLDLRSYFLKTRCARVSAAKCRAVATKQSNLDCRGERNNKGIKRKNLFFKLIIWWFQGNIVPLPQIT